MITFTFVAATKTGTLYIDGVSVGTHVFNAAPSLGATTNWNLGTTFGSYFTGQLSNVSIFNSAISSSNAAALYTEPIATFYSVPSAPTTVIAYPNIGGGVGTALISWAPSSPNGAPRSEEHTS